MNRPRFLALVVPLLAGCAPVPPGPSVHAYLFEKGAYQAVYARDGRVLRLMQDADGDRRADLVIVYEPDGGRRAEIDADRDGAVERWEVYDAQNRLLRVGQARRATGQADLWETLDQAGAVARRELDEDGDGRAERQERYATGGLAAVELDTDGDGRPDRWQSWQARRLVAEELDLDGDARPDRRLTYDPSGTPRLTTLGGKDRR